LEAICCGVRQIYTAQVVRSFGELNDKQQHNNNNNNNLESFVWNKSKAKQNNEREGTEKY